jgi:hypothetical protein
MQPSKFVPLAVIAGALGFLPARGAAEEKKLPDVPEVTKGMEVQEGVLRLFSEKQRLLAEVPRKDFGQHFLLATTFSGGTTYAGWQWTEALVAWERLDDKLLLVEKNVRYRADAGQPVEDVVRRTYSDRVMKALPILAESRNPQGGVVVDLKDLFADNAKVFFGPMGGGLDASLAKFSKIKAFPQNVEIAITMPSRGDGQLVTLHYSLAKLPKTDYRPRFADDRVGYFLTAVKDFSSGKPEDARFLRFINRWDLRKRDPSLKLSPPVKPIVFYIEKTVPIRFRRYVREGILEWNKAFEKIGFSNAIEVRQQEENNEFASFDPEDARYNFFRWITSDRSFAMGPSRVNPMTGEILDADIIFDDSMVASYLRQYDVMIRDLPKTFLSPRMQRFLETNPAENPFRGTRLESRERRAESEIADAVAAAEPGDVFAARPESLRSYCSLGEGFSHQLALGALAVLKGGEWPEEFVGSAVREIVMHEVGHTLGLRHNFKASTWLKLNEINSEKKPQATTGSVMDYAPINIALDETKQGEYIATTIGPYDYWAIEYGYKPCEKEPEELNAICSRVAEKGLEYATDEDVAAGDPYVNRWDLGEDPLEFARERVALARKLMPTILDRVVQNGESYSKARRAFDMLIYDMAFSGHVAARFVGGFRMHRDHKGDPNGRPPVVPEPAARQREALKFVCETIFADQAFAAPPELLRALAAGRWTHWGSNDETQDVDYPIHERILSIQRSVLAMLLNPETLERVEDQALKVGAGEKELSLPELFATLSAAVFTEWGAPRGTGTAASSGAAAPVEISSVRRNLQRAYLGDLIRISVQGREGAGPRITRALAWAQLRDLKERLDAALKAPRGDFEAATLAHLEECRARIAKALDASYRAE